MSRRGGTLVVVVLPQVVTFAFAVSLFGWWPLVVAPAAAALTWSYFAAFEGVYTISPRSRAHLYLGLWPMYAFWTACFMVTLAAPFALAAAIVAPWVWAIGALLGVGALTAITAMRRSPRVYRVTVDFPDLPKEFDGYTIAQLSDIHCSVFAPERRVADWVRRANRLGADLVAVTGDLVAHGNAYVQSVARALGRLRAKDGVYACLGNHDYFGAGEELPRSLERHGLKVLRNAHEAIERDGARLLVAAVDDTWVGRADPERALARRPADAFPIMLAHDPDVGPAAAALGARLTLSGHTHGGQLAVPFLARTLNLARFVTPFTAGLYRLGDSVLYVNRGVGTSGPPIRIGARAEITLLTLRANAA